MGQFSLKRLCLSVTLVAAGIAIPSYVWHHDLDKFNGDPGPLFGVYVAGAFLLPGFLIGSGLFSLGKRPVLIGLIAGIIFGIIGAAIQLAAALAIAGGPE